MKPLLLDINCDLGEGLPNDALLMPFLGSCNIACGGHAGDEKTLEATIALAKKNGVKAGAHPSFPDKENFGRKIIDLPEAELELSLIDQIRLFQSIASKHGLPMHHIKPHGALYNLAAKDSKMADLITNIMVEHFPKTTLYCPPFSEIEKSATAKGIKVAREVFADRNYNADYSLVARSHPKASIQDAAEATAHVHEMVSHNRIKTLDGNFLPIEADTLCIHGDNPKALAILKSIHKILHHETSQNFQGA
jgi:UPF0271 protein